MNEELVIMPNKIYKLTKTVNLLKEYKLIDISNVECNGDEYVVNVDRGTVSCIDAIFMKKVLKDKLFSFGMTGTFWPAAPKNKNEFEIYPKSAECIILSCFVNNSKPSLEGFKTSFEGITIDYKYLCDKNPHALENKRILEKYCDSKSNALSLIDYNNGCEQELIFDEKGMILNKWIYKKDDYKYCFPYITSGKAMSVYEIIQRVAE